MKRGTSVLKRSKLSSVSQNRKGWLALYAAEKKRRGIEQVCAVTGEKITIGVNGSFHHVRGRRTLAALLDFIPVSDVAHLRIHADPNWAMEKGFLKPEYRRSMKSEPEIIDCDQCGHEHEQGAGCPPTEREAEANFRALRGDDECKLAKEED